MRNKSYIYLLKQRTTGTTSRNHKMLDVCGHFYLPSCQLGTLIKSPSHVYILHPISQRLRYSLKTGGEGDQPLVGV